MEDRSELSAIVAYSAELSFGLPPVVSPSSKVLILGSHPGRESLQCRQYYASPQNDFWHIVGIIFGFSPHESYEYRINALTANGLAIWDVLHKCVRPGSLDIDILSGEPNDIAAFLSKHEHIRGICFNGRKAQNEFERYIPNCRLPCTLLTSSSGMNTHYSLWRKAEMWREELSLLM